MQSSPATPFGWLHLQLRIRLDRLGRGGEFGVSTVEWVIITAILVGIAATIGLDHLQLRDQPGHPAPAVAAGTGRAVRQAPSLHPGRRRSLTVRERSRPANPLRIPSKSDAQNTRSRC